MVRYELLVNKNPFSIYPYVVTRTHPKLLFDYRFCTKANVDKYKDDLPTLYRVSKR